MHTHNVHVETFDMWQRVWNTAYTRLKRLKWKQKKVEKKEGDEKQSDEDTKVHSDSSTATGEADVTGLSNGTATMQDQAAVSSLHVILEGMSPYTLLGYGLPKA